MDNGQTKEQPMTDEAMKMARRICARIVEGDSDNPLRVMKANRYLSGDLDDDHHMAIALAAIIETQELIAHLSSATCRLSVMGKSSGAVLAT